MGVQDIVAAIPTEVSGDEPDGDALRTELINGFVGYIDGSTSIVGGVLQVDPVDAALGGVRKAYVYGPDAGTFVYDALDSTTAQDGVYCIVLIGGKRYKRVGTPTVRSVISRSVTTPPASPTYGDSYLVISGAGWTAEGISANQIAVWSSLAGGSWQGVDPDYGPPLYIRDEDGYVRWVGMSGWLDGVGNGAYEDGSIPPEAFLWDDRVQNQTTNSPPSTWSKGVAYIIGSSPTGDWAGNAGKIALAESDGVLADGDTFTIITPKVGQSVYDIGAGAPYVWNGTSWISALGAWLDFSSVVTDDNSNISGGSTGTEYNYSDTVAPTQSGRCLIDGNGITYTARRSGAKIRFSYQAHVQTGSSPDSVTLVLFRDSDSNGLKWVQVFHPVTGNDVIVRGSFIVTATDALSHTYKFAVAAPTATTIAAVLRREMTLEGGA